MTNCLLKYTTMSAAERIEFEQLEQEVEYAIRRMYELVKPTEDEVKGIWDMYMDDGAFEMAQILLDPGGLTGMYNLTFDALQDRECVEQDRREEEADDIEAELDEDEEDADETRS